MSLEALKLTDGTFPRLLPSALVQAVDDNDHDVAHGIAVTGAQLDWLETVEDVTAHVVSIAGSGMSASDLTSLRLAFEGPV